MPSGEHTVEAGTVFARCGAGTLDVTDARHDIARLHLVAEIDAGLDESRILADDEAIARRHVEPYRRLALRLPSFVVGEDAGMGQEIADAAAGDRDRARRR